MIDPPPALDGYYVLSLAGDLVYTPATNIALGALIDSDEVRMFWPWSKDDRFNAWTTIIEAAAFGADPVRVAALIDHWGLVDAVPYAERAGAKLDYIGGEWSATKADGTGPAGFAGTPHEALAQLGLALGLVPGKVSHVSFPTLLAR